MANPNNYMAVAMVTDYHSYALSSSVVRVYIRAMSLSSNNINLRSARSSNQQIMVTVTFITLLVSIENTASIVIYNLMAQTNNQDNVISDSTSLNIPSKYVTSNGYDGNCLSHNLHTTAHHVYGGL